MATQTIEHQLQRPAEDLEALFPGRFLSVTSFKRDGAEHSDTRLVCLRRQTGCSRSPTCTRRRSGTIRRNPRVLIASCRPGGRAPAREPVQARAEVLTATPEFERVRELLTERYRISYRLVMLVHRLGRRLRGERSVADGAVLAITVE